MWLKILAITFLAFSLACNNAATTDEPNPQEDSLFNQVLEGHDVGMAKYGKLKRSIAEVGRLLDSLNNLPEEKLDPLYRKDLMDLQQELNGALKGMDDWMTGFVMDSAKDNPDQRIKYLESERDKVTKVREDILNSLQRADTVLRAEKE